MPIEIRELVITAAISENAQEPPQQTNETLGQDPAKKETAETQADSLIAACVEQVLAILREKSER